MFNQKTPRTPKETPARARIHRLCRPHAKRHSVPATWRSWRWAFAPRRTGGKKKKTTRFSGSNDVNEFVCETIDLPHEGHLLQ